jgi:hypothetical protein
VTASRATSASLAVLLTTQATHALPLRSQPQAPLQLPRQYQHRVLLLAPRLCLPLPPLTPPLLHQPQHRLMCRLLSRPHSLPTTQLQRLRMYQLQPPRPSHAQVALILATPELVAYATRLGPTPRTTLVTAPEATSALLVATSRTTVIRARRRLRLLLFRLRRPPMCRRPSRLRSPRTTRLLLPRPSPLPCPRPFLLLHPLLYPLLALPLCPRLFPLLRQHSTLLHVRALTVSTTVILARAVFAMRLARMVTPAVA